MKIPSLSVAALLFTLCANAQLPVQPVQDYGAILNSQSIAAARQELMRAQAQLAKQQAALLRAQQLQAEQERQLAAAQAQRADEAAADAPMQQARQAERNRLALDAQRAQILAAVHSDSTDGLRAKVATLEAVQRNSPPDSESFRSATGALLVINEELAKRGALK
jgi:hypothetical protein